MEAGPVLALPVPVGGRLPVMVDCAGGLASTSAGVGGSGGVWVGGISVNVGFGFAEARMGGCGTPAVVALWEPGRMILSGDLASASARCKHHQSAPNAQCWPTMLSLIYLESWLPLAAQLWDSYSPSASDG